MTGRDKRVLVIIICLLLANSFIYIGIPSILWYSLMPVLFWQKVVLVTLTGIYESFVIPLSIIVSTEILATFG